MTPDHSSRELVGWLEVVADREVSAGPISEPYRMWREAEEETLDTYERWRADPTPDAYVIYLAAEDRAAAAQTALARWADATSAFVAA